MERVIRLIKLCGSLAVFVLSIIIKIYQSAVTPVLNPSCRFYPSCSHYALGALKRHGFIKGCILSVRRIVSCNPYGRSGYDPVPKSFRIFQ